MQCVCVRSCVQIFKYVCKTTHIYTHLTWPYEVSAEIRSKSDSRHAGYFKYLIRNFRYLIRIKLPRKDLIRMDFLRRPGCEHKLPLKAGNALTSIMSALQSNICVMNLVPILCSF